MEGSESTLHTFLGSLRLIVSYLGQLTEPSLTAAEKGEVALEGHTATKQQGEGSKDAVLTPLDDVPIARGISTRQEARRFKTETQRCLLLNVQNLEKFPANRR